MRGPTLASSGVADRVRNPCVQARSGEGADDSFLGAGMRRAASLTLVLAPWGPSGSDLNRADHPSIRGASERARRPERAENRAPSAPYPRPHCPQSLCSSRSCRRGRGFRALSAPPSLPQSLYSSQIRPETHKLPFWARVARVIAGTNWKLSSEEALCIMARKRLAGEIGLARGLDLPEVDAWIDEQLASIGS